VLEGLGWNIIRVWSLDWWHDAERVADRVAEELAAIVSTSNGKQKPQAKKDESKAPEVEVVEPPTIPREYAFPNFQHTTVENLALFAQQAVSKYHADAEAPLYDARAKPATLEMMRVIIAREAPLLESELISRVAKQGYGYTSVGSKIRRTLEPLVKRAGFRSVYNGDTIIWRDKQDTTIKLNFRGPAESDSEKRGIAQIPLVELEALASELLPLGLVDDDLIREMGSRIGLGSVRGSSRNRVKKAVDAVWG